MLGTQLEQLGLLARRTLLEGTLMPPMARNIRKNAKLHGGDLIRPSTVGRSVGASWDEP
jgi:hypothetical protein